MRAPAYFRLQQQAPNLLGKTGTIYAVTFLDDQEATVVVALEDNQRLTLKMAQGGRSTLVPGQKVRLVWRRLRTTTEGLIEYGVKAEVIV